MKNWFQKDVVLLCYTQVSDYGKHTVAMPHAADVPVKAASFEHNTLINGHFAQNFTY